MIERGRRVTVLAVVAWLATGCTILLGEPPPPPSAEEIAAAADRMAALPRSAEATRLLNDAVTQIAAAASAIEPRLVWSWGEPGGQFGCGGVYETIGGVLVALPRYVADGPIPPSAWPEFRETARALAAAAGADVMEPDFSTPDNHHVGFEGSASLSIYTDYASTTITAGTGCRFP